MNNKLKAFLIVLGILLLSIILTLLVALNPLIIGSIIIIIGLYFMYRLILGAL